MECRRNDNGSYSLEASPGFILAHLRNNGEIARTLYSLIIYHEKGLYDWVEMPETVGKVS